jgi:hypothetical protein
LSNEHFSVDGTQGAAWASMKSFRATDGSDESPLGGCNGERDFHGETRSNVAHASTMVVAIRWHRAASPWEPTRLTMRTSSSTICATSTSRHRSHRTRQAQLGDRRPHDSPPRLRHQSAEAQENRGAFRLGQDDRRARPPDAARCRTFEIQVHTHHGSLRTHPVAEVAWGVRMRRATLGKIERRPQTLSSL